MGEFVHDDALPAYRPLAGHGVVAVENGGCRFHPAANAVGLNVRQLFVDERPDVAGIEIECLVSWHGEIVEARVAVLVIDPGLDGFTVELTDVLHGKSCGAERVQPGRGWHRLLPVRQAQPVAQVGTAPAGARSTRPGSGWVRRPAIRWWPCRRCGRPSAASVAPCSASCR